MRLKFIRSLTTAVLFFGSVAPGPLTAGAREELRYAEILTCGKNSLLMFLVLNGSKDITLSQLDGVQVGPDGVSLLNLRDTATQFGFETQVRHYLPEDVDKMPLPAIAQIYTSRTTLTGLHFGVFYKKDRERLYVIDGTTAELYTINRRKVTDFWSGYALTNTQSRFNRGLKILLVIIFAVSVAAFVAVFVRNYPKFRSA